MPDPKVKTLNISDLVPDRRNANKGTKRGVALLNESLKDLGAGRSILLDKDGEIIAGNKTTEAASDLGYEKVLVVETDGKTLVAVQRTDLDLDNDPRARRLAIADNRVGEIDLAWDANTLLQLSREDPETVAGLWSPDEWEKTVLSQLSHIEPEEESDEQTTELDQSVQLKPQREYCMIVAETPEQWENLKVLLDLRPVRRGGYKQGSVFDHVGTQRVVLFDHFLELLQAYVDNYNASPDDQEE